MHIKCPYCEKDISIDIPILKEEPCIIADTDIEYRAAIKIIARDYLRNNPGTDRRYMHKRCKVSMCINPNHITWHKLYS